MVFRHDLKPRQRAAVPLGRGGQAQPPVPGRVCGVVSQYVPGLVDGLRVARQRFLDIQAGYLCAKYAVVAHPVTGGPAQHLYSDYVLSFHEMWRDVNGVIIPQLVVALAGAGLDEDAVDIQLVAGIRAHAQRAGANLSEGKDPAEQGDVRHLAGCVLQPHPLAGRSKFRHGSGLRIMFHFTIYAITLFTAFPRAVFKESDRFYDEMRMCQ